MIMVMPQMQVLTKILLILEKIKEMRLTFSQASVTEKIEIGKYEEATV